MEVRAEAVAEEERMKAQGELTHDKRNTPVCASLLTPLGFCVRAVCQSLSRRRRSNPM